MTKPLIHFSSLLDRAAFEHLQNKTLLPSFSHYDVWLYEHSVGFTVAKMMDMDLLAETKSAVVSALENGTDFRDFKNRLKPYLMAKGWWGEQVMLDPVDGVAKTVQLGSTRRLRVIFQTNLFSNGLRSRAMGADSGKQTDVPIPKIHRQHRRA